MIKAEVVGWEAHDCPCVRVAVQREEGELVHQVGQPFCSIAAYCPCREPPLPVAMWRCAYTCTGTNACFLLLIGLVPGPLLFLEAKA